MRDTLDSHVLKLVAPVLRRLRVRNPGLRVFVSLGGTTLGSPAGTARLLTVLEQERDIASGIVFEIRPGRRLRQLDKTGIENLAQLGRLGATMALSNVAVAGARPAGAAPARRALPVHPAARRRCRLRPGVGLARLRAICPRHAVPDHRDRHSTRRSRPPPPATCVRFGYGPFFAPPRKVRSDAGVAPGQPQRQRGLTDAGDAAVSPRRYPVWFCDIWGVVHNGRGALSGDRRGADAAPRAGRHRHPRHQFAAQPAGRRDPACARSASTPASHDRIVTSGDVTQVTE